MNNLAYKGNIIQFPTLDLIEGGKQKTDSIYKSNGVKKATAAEPIRNPEDIKKMCQYFKDTNLRNYAIFVTGITLGIRGSDLIKLKVKDITADRITLIEKKTKKRNSPIITDKAREALDMYLSTREDLSEDDYVFISPTKDESGKHKHITIQTLNNIVKKAASECEVKGHISSHSLRKTFAYQLLQIYEFDEEARFTLQTMLNHSDMRTTMVYSGVTTDKQDNMRMALADMIL